MASVIIVVAEERPSPLRPVNRLRSLPATLCSIPQQGQNLTFPGRNQKCVPTAELPISPVSVTIFS